MKKIFFATVIVTFILGGCGKQSTTDVSTTSDYLVILDKLDRIQEELDTNSSSVEEVRQLVEEFSIPQTTPSEQTPVAETLPVAETSPVGEFQIMGVHNSTLFEFSFETEENRQKCLNAPNDLKYPSGSVPMRNVTFIMSANVEVTAIWYLDDEFNQIEGFVPQKVGNFYYFNFNLRNGRDVYLLNFVTSVGNRYSGIQY